MAANAVQGCSNSLLKIINDICFLGKMALQYIG